MRLTKEQKKMRKEFAEIKKKLDKEAGRDRIKYLDNGFGGKFRSFVICGGTEVSEGGWMIGRKWMTAKYMSSIVHKWVMQSYETRADTYLKREFSVDVDIEKLKEIDSQYDLSAGCAQCGGCRWFAAIDGDYGFCFNQKSPNEGRITFEHGGCIQHSFIQRLLNEVESN